MATDAPPPPEGSARVDSLTPGGTDSVTRVLASVGLAKYASVLAGHEIDFEALRLLTDDDLKELGLPLGPRRKLLAALQDLGAEPTPGVPPRLTNVTALTEAADRRQLTVLFSDLVDWTRLSAQIDPEQLHILIRDYHDACAEAIRRYDGHIAQYLGDGVLAYFGHPRAHEDDAQRAIRAGLEVVTAMRLLNARLGARAPVRLSVRVGIHTGVVVVGEVGGGEKHERLALGNAPNVAARLQSLAEPDTIVISERTRQLTGGTFECADLGVQSLKGVAEAIRVWRVEGPRRVSSRFDAATRGKPTPLVGREQEIGVLLDRWQLVKEGMGQMVLVSGEAGIGKSRVLRDLYDRIRPEISTSMRFQCSPFHTGSAFHPIIESFAHILELSPGDSPETRLERLETVMLGRYQRPLRDLQLVASILSVPAEEKYGAVSLNPRRQREETIRALLDLAEAAVQQQPSLMLFEDAHWSDPSSLEVLDHLARRLDRVPMLVLVSHRPDLSLRIDAPERVTRLALSRLSPAQSNAIVSRLLAGRSLPANVLEQIVDRTDGVPLFVEELTKAVLESPGAAGGSLPFGANGGGDAITVPATLRDSLMSRLDRVPMAKLVAQIGSLIGRDFRHDLVTAVAPVPAPEVDGALQGLVESGLILARNSSVGPVYTFKHALLQDVASDSLLRSTRQELHGKLARTLEDRFPETARTHPELLAHHYTQASLVEPAVRYWQQAGALAVKRSADVEAVGHLERGIELLAGMPDSIEKKRGELDLYTALTPVLVSIRGYASPEVEAAHARAHALCEEVGNVAQRFAVLRHNYQLALLQARYRLATQYANQLLALAGVERNSALAIDARIGLGFVALYAGKFREAIRQIDRALSLVDPEEHRDYALRYGVDLAVSCLAYDARARWFLGFPDLALQRAVEAVERSQTSPVSLSVAQAIGMLAVLYQTLGDIENTREWTERTIAYSLEHGHPYWAALGNIVRGWLKARSGEPAAGCALMDRSLAAYQATGARLGMSWFLLLKAEARQAAGELEQALEILAGARAHVKATGEAYYEAEILCSIGALMLAREGLDAAPQAERWFQRALGVATRQHARGWQLRAATDLARLRIAQDQGYAARELLTPIIESFSEGFESADMRAALALL